MKLSDFKDLSAVELRLVDWLRDGNRKVYVVSDTVPVQPTVSNTIRATLIRYLALGGCEGCRPPETGVQVRGAWIDGDNDKSDETTGLDLAGATLLGDLALLQCQIPDPIILYSSKVNNVFLNDSNLQASISADRLEANDSVSLLGAKVASEVRLVGERLGGDLTCIGAELNSDKIALNCDAIQVDGSVFLRKATIAGEIKLMGAQVGGELSCIGAELRAKGSALSCIRASIVGTFFLREGTKVSGCIDLTGASMGAINDDTSCWPPEFLLNLCRFEAFLGRSPTDAKSRLRWLAVQNPEKYGLDFWPDPYEQCAKVLSEMGYTADARAILIEKERLQRKARRARVEKELQTARNDRAKAPEVAGLRLYTDRVIGHWLHLAGLNVWDAILGAVVGYGRKPQNAAYWALSMLLIGWIVFAHAAGHGAIKPNLPQIQLNPTWVDCADDPRGQLDCFLNAPQAASYPRFNAFIYSADTLIPVVTLEMQSYWIPDDRSDRGMLVRAYLWFHIAMGWALTLLAVAGFSGLIKTDSK